MKDGGKREKVSKEKKKIHEITERNGIKGEVKEI